MEHKEVDVIVTNCNLNTYLDAAVRSALDQDGVRTRVIVVDDASDVPPDHGDWPQDRVRLLLRDSRGGQGAAINTGLAASRAGLVAFLDADDLLPAHRSRRMVDSLRTRDADLVFGGQAIFNDGTCPQLRIGERERAALPAATAGLLPGTVLMTRQFIDRAGPLDEMGYGGFIAWMDRARRLQPAITQVALNEVVLLRRSHADNVSRAHRAAVVSSYFDLVARHRARP